MLKDGDYYDILYFFLKPDISTVMGTNSEIIRDKEYQ